LISHVTTVLNAFFSKRDNTDLTPSSTDVFNYNK